MTYPEGDLLARNLVERPKFDSSGATEGWDAVYGSTSLYAASLDVAPKSWAADEHRLSSTSTDLNGFYRVDVPVEALDRGLYVYADYLALDPSGGTEGLQVGLVPILSTAYGSREKELYTTYPVTASGSWATETLPPTSAATLLSGELTVPALPADWSFDEGGGYVWDRSHAVGAHLVFRLPSNLKLNSTGFVRVRADYADTSVTGYLDGDTTDTAEVDYAWASGGMPSITTATNLAYVEPAPEPEPEPTPEPEPEPEPTPEDPDGTTDPAPDPAPAPSERHPLAGRLAAYLGRKGSEEALDLADAQLPIVQAFIEGYTRGKGFVDGKPAAPLEAVIISATARLVANPDQVTWYQVGDYSERPAVLNGYTLAELGVLHRYRRRAA